MKPSNQYAIAFTLALTICAMPADAIGKRDISITTAENGVQLSLSRGYGVVLNLSTIGQTVSTAWLSDPSQITLASNQGPCTGDACAGSSVLYLKPIEKLKFPGLPTAVDGASLLSVITNRGQVLQFKLTVNSSVPSYTNIALVPPASPPTPIVPLQQARTPAPPTLRTPVKEPEIVISLPEREEELDTLSSLLKRTKQSKPQDEAERVAKAESPEQDEPTQSATEISVEVEPKDFNTEISPDIEKKEVDADSLSEGLKPTKEQESGQPNIEVKEVEVESSSEESKPIQQKKSGQSDDSSDRDELAKPKIIKTDTESVVIAVLEPVEEETEQANIERTNQELAGALLRGLHSPQGKKEVGRSIHYYRAQDAIWLLRKERNISLSDALRRSRMNESIAEALINYGTK